MTKVSILGQANEVRKSIELVSYLTADYFSIKEAWQDVSKMDEVILISKKGFCNGDYDIILCIRGDEQVLFLGHWNDGVV